jgi:3-oxoacyl-[acyl-carrier-protein] synthase III
VRFMNPTIDDVIAHLLRRLNEVSKRFDGKATSVSNPNECFADALDSMGMVEFLAVLAEDCGVTVAAIEECTGRKFGTVAELAAHVHVRGWLTAGKSASAGQPFPAEQSPRAMSPLASRESRVRPAGWLAATAVRLPQTIQSAAAINAALQRPPGWLERHAGIDQRRLWAEQDPLEAAADAGRACLHQAGLAARDVGALLVTSEAPPTLTGLAAALHHLLQLRVDTVALEIGTACSGFLSALWTAQALFPQVGVILVMAVEAPSRYLHLQPGPVGENAALFGDAAAASVLCAEAGTHQAARLTPVQLGVDGSSAGLLQVELSGPAVAFRMRRIELASRAVEAMAQSIREMIASHGQDLDAVTGIVCHAGNGRMSGLLARKLGLPADRVWSETARTGNLGSASLPVAWAARQPLPPGPVIWTAVGAGLMWGAVMVGAMNENQVRPGPSLTE